MIYNNHSRVSQTIHLINDSSDGRGVQNLELGNFCCSQMALFNHGRFLALNEECLARFGTIDVQKQKDYENDTDICHALTELNITVAAAGTVFICGSNNQRPISS